MDLQSRLALALLAYGVVILGGALSAWLSQRLPPVIRDWWEPPEGPRPEGRAER